METKIIDYIVIEFKKGNLTLGSKLPTERELSKILNISINEVKMELKFLKNLKIIEAVQGSGNYITNSLNLDNIIELMDFMINIGLIKVSYVYDFRKIIEKQLFDNNDIQITEECITNMEFALNEMKIYYKFKDAEEILIKNDFKFHTELIKCLTNPLISNLIYILSSTIKNSIGEFWKKSNDDSKHQLIDIHEKILKLIVKYYNKQKISQEDWKELIELHYKKASISIKQ